MVPPTRVAATAAVVTNFLAGTWAQDLSPLVEVYCARLGTLLAEETAAILGAPAEAFGKGALVGIDGEIEHGSAILHNLKFGNPVRAGLAMPSPCCLPRRSAAPPARTRYPPENMSMTSRSARITRHSRSGSRCARANEMLIVVALSSSGRPLARLGAFGTDFSSADARAL